jgi:anaerobic magnesium-protoporphyrin IX monomethyl ester cyclase
VTTPSSFKILGSQEESQLGRFRNTSRPVMLVGFLAQQNLGLGYLASSLRAQGYRVEIVDFELPAEHVVATAKRLGPLLIGFSLIFQFYIERFQSLMMRLREAGVTCHFTMGGHFPSLSHREALGFIPELDSVVRFEGEETLLELADLIGQGRDWRGMQGIAYCKGGEIQTNQLRPLIEDLDKLPYPDRSFEPGIVLGHPIFPILASRGCARTCSFCSIHMFYRSAPGKVVRTRKPVEVVREMRYLYENGGATIFLFQDDDFPLFGPVWKRWAREFVAELTRNDLVGRVMWKISCRADAVDPDLFAEMSAAGLYFVYMGLESGTEEGLKTLHKQITAEQNLRAVEILKNLSLAFQFGFMLFEPSSTFESIYENIEFLHTIVDDGSVALAFCRMIPYDGTPIKDELIRTGRLTGDICHPGYDFLDPRLNRYYHALTQVVDLRGWVHGYDSLSPKINIALNEIAVLERLFPPLADMDEYKRALRNLTAASNGVLFDIVASTAQAFERDEPLRWTREMVETECKRFLAELVEMRDGFMLRHQDELLNALAQRKVGPVAYPIGESSGALDTGMNAVQQPA